MNTNLLKSQFIKNGLTQVQVARLLGMSPNSLSRKVLQKREFTLGETLRIKDCLQLTDQMYSDIFLQRPFKIRNVSDAQ